MKNIIAVLVLSVIIHNANAIDWGTFGSGPMTTDPFFTGPQITDPYGSGPKTTDPFFTGPQTTDPYGSGPKTTDPFFTGPQTTDPYGSGPKTTDPYFTGPQTTDPYGPGPKTRDPFATGPQTTNPYPTNKSDPALCSQMQSEYREVMAHANSVSGDPGLHKIILELARQVRIGMQAEGCL